MASAILVPQSGTEPVPPALEAQSYPLDGQGSLLNLKIFKLRIIFGHATSPRDQTKPGIKPKPPAFEMQNLNLWTTREVNND